MQRSVYFLYTSLPSLLCRYALIKTTNLKNSLRAYCAAAFHPSTLADLIESTLATHSGLDGMKRVLLSVKRNGEKQVSAGTVSKQHSVLVLLVVYVSKT